MRPKQRQTTGSGDLFRARLDQIINMKHKQAQTERVSGCLNCRRVQLGISIRRVEQRGDEGSLRH
jgi:hypothetical protein